jgi:peptide/nickel transport system substrate-binding protein
LDIGDYVSNLLEDVGFTVNRQYKTSPEASAIWNQTDPNDGLWHLYTAGWISNQISRDLGWVFDFYNSDRVLPWIRWSYHDTGNPEYDAAAERLQNNDFGSMEERAELFDIALRGHMAYAAEVMLFDATSFTPRRKEVEVTADLAAAVAGADLWPYTIRRSGEVGGAMTIGMPSILTEPWNPVAGTNWVYDQSLINATGDYAVVFDPYTGLRRPQRLETADVHVHEGLPVAKTLDWVNLEFVPENIVPDDAWVDWDAENQVFLTASEVYTQPVDATMKLVCNYEDTLYDTKWHDGSNFSIGDVVMTMIMQFDNAKEASAIYDEDQVPILSSFLSVFRGWRITSEDPLVVEYYTDYVPLDAENAINNNWWCGYPQYSQGIGAWHLVALGNEAEAAGELAVSQPKSDRLEVEWMSYIGGPSLDILATHLERVAAESLIPYAPTMGQYVTEEEAATRWANYQSWYDRRGHFWIGNGPYYLEGAFPIEGSVILKHFADYPDPAEKWSGYAAPKIAEVEVDGPGRVAAGAEATYDVYITFEGEPYPLDELDSVKYLVFDATGMLAFSGLGEPAEDGRYTITLSADQTSGLEPGANRIEVIVASKVVSVPSSGTFEFVTE